MKNFFNDSFVLSSAGLFFYFVSFFWSGTVELIILLATVVLMAVAFWVSLKNETYKTNKCLFYTAVLSMVLCSLFGNLGFDFLMSSFGLLAFVLFTLLAFKVMYFLQKICHKNCEDEFDKED